MSYRWSPQTRFAMLAASKAHARIQGRSGITADDVHAIAPFVLRHRLIVSGTTADAVLRQALSAIPAPA